MARGGKPPATARQVRTNEQNFVWRAGIVAPAVLSGQLQQMSLTEWSRSATA